MHQDYQGTKVDIFAMGVLLFIMVSAHPPFRKAVPSDPYYKLLWQNKYNVFWAAHEKGKPKGFFSN